MQLGRVEGSFLCDLCGEPLTTPFTVVPAEGGKVLRFCRISQPLKPTDCLAEYYFREHVEAEVEKRIRSELKEIYSRVCPADRARLKPFLP
jgi:hypothetical protein